MQDLIKRLEEKKTAKNRRGFTIVELSLSLIFVAIILITIAMLVIYVTTTYQKGLSIRGISSGGKNLIDEFDRSISASVALNPKTLCTSKFGDLSTGNGLSCINDGARKFLYQERFGTVTLQNGATEKVPMNGSFCTGTFSYIWNTGYALNDEDYKKPYGTSYRFSVNGNNNFRLVRVVDGTNAVCKAGMSGYDINSSFNSLNGLSEVTEIFSQNEDDLVLYDLTMYKPAVHYLTGHAIYSGTFILGTLHGSVNINSVGDFCTDPPNNLNTDFAYCAINKFNFTMRATGQTKN